MRKTMMPAEDGLNPGNFVQRTARRTVAFLPDLDWGDPSEADTIPGTCSPFVVHPGDRDWAKDYWT